MSSLTRTFMTRVRLKTKKMGRKRKNQLVTNGSTPSQAVFFGDAPKAKPSK